MIKFKRYNLIFKTKMSVVSEILAKEEQDKRKRIMDELDGSPKSSLERHIQTYESLPWYERLIGRFHKSETYTRYVCAKELLG